MDNEKITKDPFSLLKPIVPERAEKFVKQLVFEQEYLFKLKDEIGRRYDYYTCCKAKDYNHTTCRHNEVVQCPHCHSRVTVKDGGRSRENLVDFGRLIVLQRAGNMLVFRYCICTRQWQRNVENVKMQFHEEYSLFLDKESQKVYQYGRGLYVYENKRWADWWNAKVGDVYEKAPWHRMSSVKEYRNGYNYDTPIFFDVSEKDIAECGFQYADIKKYRHKEFISYMTRFCRYQRVTEFLDKCGFDELLKEMLCHNSSSDISWRSKTPERLFGISKEDIRLLKEDQSCSNLRKLKLLQQYKLKKEEKIYILKNISEYSFRYDFEKSLKYLSLPKIINYIQKQGITAREYNDYITDCEFLNFDLKTDAVLRPKDFDEAHKRTNQLRRAETIRQNAEKELAKQKNLNKGIKNRFKALSEIYDFHSNGMFIRPAKDLKEIIIEGKTQKICVGRKEMRYTERHSDGVAFILFLRKEEEPDLPFYTVEISNSGQILQCRGYQNKGKTPEVERFIKDFENYLRQPKQKSA